MNMKRLSALLGLAVAVAASITVLVSHNRQPAQDPDKLQVVASFYPLYDFAQNIGGTHVNVTNITPAGAEPHDYEPAPKDLIRAQNAPVFIYNGGTLEPWASKFLSDYHHVAVKASNGIMLRDAAGESGGTIKDPHFWLDPVLAGQIVRNIRDGFIAADPTHKRDYTDNANRYLAQLKELDNRFRGGLAHCQQDTLISSHAAFGYVAARYGFTVDSISGISPDQEPSSAKMAELTALAKEKHITHIFFESLVSPRLADTIAQEVGAKTLVFDPLEGLTETAQKNGKNYLTVQRDNLTALRTALACQ